MARKRARHNGEGSIFPYRNGYAAYAWVTTPAGRRVRKYVYGQDRETVHAKWVKLLDEARKGAIATTVPTVSDYLDRWYDEVVRPGLGRKTAESHEQRIRLYIKPALGRKRLNKLTVRDVRRWLNELAETCQCCAQGKDANRPAGTQCCSVGECCEQTLSRTTLQDARGTLRTALNNAIAEDLISKNPAALVKIPNARRPRKVKPWSVEQAQRFLESAKIDRDPFYAAYVLILVLGLRRSEVLGLPWSNVSLDAAELYVGQGLQRVDHKLMIGPVKTEASEAPLPLPEICVAALRDGRKLQENCRAEAEAWLNEHDLVFTTRYGTPIEPRNFVRSFKARCRKAGVPEIKVHGTRHTCGSLLAALGVHPRVAMQILRHSKINITMEIYTHVPSSETQEALKRLGQSLTGSPEVSGQ